MTDSLEATTPQVEQPGNKTKPTEYRPHEQWEPVGGDFRLSVPVAWQCPCGHGVYTALGQQICRNCGRIARDAVPHGKLDGSQRCTTGRQGREWKRAGWGRM